MIDMEDNMNDVAFSILLVLIGIFVGCIIMVVYTYLKKSRTSKKSEDIIEKAKKEAEKIKRDNI